MSLGRRYCVVRTDPDGVDHIFDGEETQIPYCGRLRSYFKHFKVWAVKESDYGRPGKCHDCLEKVITALENERASGD